MYAKHYETPTILSRVTIKNSWMFFETQCILIYQVSLHANSA